jgi:hypothetical protein
LTVGRHHQNHIEQTVATGTIEQMKGEADAGGQTASRIGMAVKNKWPGHSGSIVAMVIPALQRRFSTWPQSILRTHRAESVLLIVAIASVIAFASWLSIQLRPAIAERERHDQMARAKQEAVESCRPGRDRTAWCGKIAAAAPAAVPPQSVMTLAPVAFCTPGPAPSC